MKIIYLGTPSIAAVVLESLIESGVEVLAVVTKADKPRGRSGKLAFSPVKALVRENYPTIPLYQPDKASTPAFEEELKKYGADLFVVFAYGEIIKQHLLDLPRFGCINLHPSLLPKYRGPAPIVHTLLNGDRETGVTVIEMVLKMDAGDILAQERMPIPDAMDCGELEQALVKLGAETLLRVINNFSDHEARKIPQDPEKATIIGFINPSMAQIDWSRPATAIHHQIRAFSPKPGAWCQIKMGDQLKRLKIFSSEVISENKKLYKPGLWVVPCGEGALSILELQLEGKNRLSIDDFTRGSPEPKLT